MKKFFPLLSILLLIGFSLLLTLINLNIAFKYQGIGFLSTYLEWAFSNFLYIVLLGPILEESIIRGIVSKYSKVKHFALILAYILFIIIQNILYTSDTSFIQNIGVIYYIPLILPFIFIIPFRYYRDLYASQRFTYILYGITTLIFIFLHTDILLQLYNNEPNFLYLGVRISYLFITGSIYYYFARFVSLKSAIGAHMLGNFVVLLTLLIYYIQFNS